MKTIDDYHFKDKKALVRVDFNVPLDEKLEVTDDSRIKGAIRTLKKILQDGGSVILMSHLGRPKGGFENKFSLKHVLPVLNKLIGQTVAFADDCIGPEAEKAAGELQPGQVLLLENLRFHPEEEKGDRTFASALAKLGSVYVNDAFGTAHRAHASTTIIAQFFPHHCLFGYLMAGELKNAEKVLNHASHPFTAIMGGSKVSDKIELIKSLLTKVDNLIIGGGMSYTFTKSLGGSIGKSLVEEDKLSLATELLSEAKANHVQVFLPVDTIIADKFAETAETSVSPAGKINDDWMGLDIGPETIENFSKVIAESKTILWNGPVGVFEMEKFEKGTKAIAMALVEATKNGAFTLIGGGDSAAAISKFYLTDAVSYVSTGGGALLEYMEGKELPGVKALLENE